MARYINEDDFVAWVKEHWCANCDNDNGLRCRACWIDDAIDIVEEAPEADVVPKSEYEAVVSAVDNSTKEFLKLHDAYQDSKSEAERLQKALDAYEETSGLKQAKADVARAIFAEIWSSIAAHTFTSKSEDYADGAYDTIEWVDSKIAEIEKKYILKDCRKCRFFVGCEQAVWVGACDDYEEVKT